MSFEVFFGESANPEASSKLLWSRKQTLEKNRQMSE